MKNDEEKESDFVEKLVLYLSKHFKIEREVWSDCKNGRIDIIITSKEGYRFGIECKRNDSKRGEEIGKFIHQAVRYANYTFYGVKIPIFIAPPLSYNYFILAEEKQEIKNEEWFKDRHISTHEHHTINGMLGTFLVGELRRLNKRFILSFSNKIIWDSDLKWGTKEVKGVHEDNYRKLLEKIK